MSGLERMMESKTTKNTKSTINVQGTAITVLSQQDDDFMSLTDMLKAKDGDFFISDWLRNRNTVEFLGIWERVHNPRFNYGEFATIRNQAGLNSYKISVKEWVEKTNAMGLRATTGRYGGTYAHKDIAFEFGMWISPEFKIYLIKEFQRLKTDESRRLSLDWNLSRTLSKLNYRIHTDAIKAHLIPAAITLEQARHTYANEADVLNMALFGQTAKQWRDAHPDLAGNMRDDADLTQLLVLANLESLNAEFIHMGLGQADRLIKLNQNAIRQLQSLTAHVGMKALGLISA
jgi:KilA-N domain